MRAAAGSKGRAAVEVQFKVERSQLRYAQRTFVSVFGDVQHFGRADRPKLRFGCPARLRRSGVLSPTALAIMRVDRDHVTHAIAELRELWCQWDPIGVMPLGWPKDEYDDYLGATLALLEEGASLERIENYLANVAFQTMGLSSVSVAPKEFALKLGKWFQENWSSSPIYNNRGAS